MTATALEWSGGRARLPSARIPFYLLLLGFPIWWALGAWAFMWPLLAIPLAFALLMRGEIRLPPYFAVWLLFLGWVAVSSASLEGSSTVLGFSFRAAFYLSATGGPPLCLQYAASDPAHRLGGQCHHRLFHCDRAGRLGRGARARSRLDQRGRAVHAGEPHRSRLCPRARPPDVLAAERLHGLRSRRPHPFFAYTNEWGSTVALLAPVAVLARESARSPAWRWATLAALVGAVMPLVLSLNRGAWVSLLVAVAFVAMRLLISGRLRNLGRIVVLALALTGVVFLTGGAGVITDRIDHGHSDKGRGELYGETIHRSMESPVSATARLARPR